MGLFGWLLGWLVPWIVSCFELYMLVFCFRLNPLVALPQLSLQHSTVIMGEYWELEERGRTEF